MSFTVGQLAKLTGLTVRALHHYHAIGLLEPSQRSESGYRLYTQADIVRLFRIQALQRLNLSLNEVAAVLAKDGAPLPEMLAQQLDELDDRIEKATALRSRLSQLHEVLTRGGEPVANDWLAAVELITQYDEYCSSDELQRLLVHSNTDKDQWRSVLAELREAVRRDVPVQSEHAQTLADRWMQLMLSRVGGDAGLAIKMKLAYHAQPDLQARMQAQSGLETETLDYLTRALRHGNLAAWARHLDSPALERLRMPDDRMRELLRVAAELRGAGRWTLRCWNSCNVHATSAATGARSMAGPDLSKRIVYHVDGMHEARVRRDVVYKRDAGAELEMSIYAPSGLSGDARLPAVLFVHGGPIPAAFTPPTQWGKRWPATQRWT